MDVRLAIESRRAYRSLEKVVIADETVNDLALSAGLAPSCFNKQPWRFVFVRDAGVLMEMRKALSKGNEWIYEASMIVAVASAKELDCVVKEREYFLFDTGMACAFLQLRATELGLIAHPIAGFDEAEAKRILDIPQELTLVTLINVGKHASEINPVLSDWQRVAEAERPPRMKLAEFAFREKYGKV